MKTKLNLALTSFQDNIFFINQLITRKMPFKHFLNFIQLTEF